MFDEEPYKIINCKYWSYDNSKDRIEIKYEIDTKDESNNNLQILLFHNMVILTHHCNDAVDIIHDCKYLIMYKKGLNKD